MKFMSLRRRLALMLYPDFILVPSPHLRSPIIDASDEPHNVVEKSQSLITLAETLAAHQGVTHFAISMRAMGKGDFFKRLQKPGADCRTGTATRLAAWFSENWPSDLEWPRNIPRPQKSKKEAA